MPRLSWSCRKSVGVRPDRVRTIIHGQTPEVGAVCPNWARTVLCGGALSIRPPKHAASDNHRRSTTRRSSLSSSETPGVSAERRASAVVLLDQGAPVLHSHDRVPFFAGSMISSPAAARRRASCLTDSAERRRVRCSCDASCAVLFPGSSIRHPHERGCHSGAAASIPAMTAMNVTAMQRRSTGAEKNTNMVASTLLAQ